MFPRRGDDFPLIHRTHSTHNTQRPNLSAYFSGSTHELLPTVYRIVEKMVPRNKDVERVTVTETPVVNKVYKTCKVRRGLNRHLETTMEVVNPLCGVVRRSSRRFLSKRL